MIRYSRPASCPEENSSGLHSLSSSSSPSPYSHLHFYQPSQRYNSIRYIMQDTGTASRFFSQHLFSSTNISPCLCLSGTTTLLPFSPFLSLTLRPFHFLPSVIFSLSLCLVSSLSPPLTCHSRPVSVGRNERCGCNYHPLRECGSLLWLRVTPDHDNACR